MTKQSALPNGWRWVRLGEVAEYMNGRAFKPEEWGRSGLPIIRIENLNSPTALFNCFEGRVDPRNLVNDGDLLISWSASLDAYKWCGGPAVLNQHIFKVEEKREFITREYLYFATRQAMREIRLQVHGATMRHITKPEFEAIQIPLPPLEEQKRIATVLNDQMAAVERARAAAETQLDAAKALPAAYLRAVFSSPEAQLWPLRKLGEVAPIIQNGIYKTSDNYGHGRPFLRMYNVQNDSWKLTLEPLALVALGGSERITFGLKKGDLLISRVNSYELVGKCAWVGPEAEGYVFENMLIRVRLEVSVDSLFVAQQFATRGVRGQIESVAKRAIGQASINSEDVRAIQLVLPPLSDQQRIAAMLNEQMASAERVRKAIEEELDTVNKLPAALLRRAFNGEL